MAVRFEILVDDKGTPHIKRFTDETKREFDALKVKSASITSDMSSRWRGLRSNISLVTAAIGSVALATGGIVMAVKRTIEYADSMNDLSRATGISTETLSKMDFAAKQSGTSIGAVSMAMKVLAQNAVDATTTNSEATRSFKEMKINVEETGGKLKSVEQLFLEVSDYIARATDKSRAMGLAAKVLGRGVLELGSMMAGGRKEIEQLMAQGEKFNLVTTEQGRTADEAADAFGAFNAAIQKLTREAIMPMLPALTKLVNFMAEAAGGVMDFARMMAEVTARNWVMATIAAAGAFEKLKKAVEEVNKPASELPKTLGTGIPEAANRATEEIEKLGNAVSSVKAAMDLIAEAQTAGKASAAEYAAEWERVHGSVAELKDELIPVPPMLDQMTNNVQDQKGAWDGVQISTGIMSGLLANIITQGAMISNIFSNIANVIMQQLIDQLLEAVLTAETLEAVLGAIGSVGGSFLSLFGLSKGAVVLGQRGFVTRGPVPAIIGEAGPEAVVPLSPGKWRERQAVMQAAGLTNNLSFNVNVNARNFDRNFVKMELVPLLNREVKKGMALYASHVK